MRENLAQSLAKKKYSKSSSVFFLYRPPERLDSVIATLPPLLDQRIAAGCHLDPQGQGTARHGSASVRTDTQTMPASAANHTRGATPAHARLPSCAECERGMDLHTMARWREARAAHALDAVSGS